MNRKRFSVEQIVAVLKQAEAGVPVQLPRKTPLIILAISSWRMNCQTTFLSPIGGLKGESISTPQP